MRRALFIFGLIIAGEAVFALPFHITRFFRPTVLEVFGFTNAELGAAQGVYGICAMLAYFPGGPLADRYPARKLLAVSLWSTAAGGLYMATIPSHGGAMALWGFFGITTILLFWAALIRATRDWGAADRQGGAYGLLEGGRGALAALLAQIALFFFAAVFPADGEAITDDVRREALQTVIYGYVVATALAGVLVWFVVGDGGPGRKVERWRPDGENLWRHIGRVIAIPAVWMQAVIIVCAYVAYKGYDNYSLFAVQVYGLSEVDAGRVVVLGQWMRPLTALVIGVVADFVGVARMTTVCFALLLASYLFFAFDSPAAGTTYILLGNTLVTCIGMFGLRGLYFALFEEARVPAVATGTAVGLVSVIGYTPDIFVNLIGGLLLDASPGLPGHQHFFMFLASFAALGLLVSALLMRTLARKPAHS